MGVYGVVSEMERGGEAAVEWIWKACMTEWNTVRVPDQWTKVVTILLYYGKGSKSDCKNYRGTSQLGKDGKVYERLLMLKRS